MTSPKAIADLHKLRRIGEPARYTADLAASLNNLGGSLQEAGEHREALTTAGEAVALYRELAAAEPARYTANLAISLNNLGSSLVAVGGQRESLLAAAEAVAWWGRLNRLHPGDINERYRVGQRELARRFAEAGQPPGAAVLAEQDAARRLPAGRRDAAAN